MKISKLSKAIKSVANRAKKDKVPETIAKFDPRIGGLLGIAVRLLAKEEPAAPTAEYLRLGDVSDIAATDLLRIVEQATGKDVSDDDLFCEGIREMGRGWVKIRRALKDAK